MKRHFLISVLFFVFSVSLYPQEKIKNLILMIPDGTSSSILSLARWYKFGVCAADNCRLAIDPHLCGLVSTYNSDSPIGDSAPTGSTYATGHLSNTGFVATYPVSSGAGRDLIRVDPLKAYHPMFTILEATQLQGKSTGLVVTCEFPHATPADFSAHTPNREDKEGIAIQMVHNHLDVLFGGGMQYLDPVRRADGRDLLNELRLRNYTLASTVEQFQSLTPADTPVYGIFAEKDLPYDLDRDPTKVPSLAEMTKKAIQILARNPNGFFLMVEGSKIDWAAHANDATGIITEYLAFDEAVKEAIDFANRDGYTAVVVAPDHGNSGISLGNRRTEGDYDELPLNDLTGPLRACKRTAEGIARLIGETPSNTGKIFFDNTGIRLSSEQIQALMDADTSTNINLLPSEVARLISDNTCVGFTTHGHTGEDVMLAVYHPGNYRPSGVLKNVDLNHYMTRILGIPDLDSLTKARFSIDSVALKGLDWQITEVDRGRRLVIRSEKEKNLRAEIEASTDYIIILKKEKPVKRIPIGSLAIFVEPLQHFFIPKFLGDILKEELLYE
ncbi:MAG: alkaline phosphatase [Bacteroidales bacterium]|nr:alkaline phosphatase [Bacteroidales bacterium]